MTNIDIEITERILKADGLRPAALGLRFDRVALSLLGALRTFAAATAPAGTTVLATVTAPIRLPARTVDALKGEIGGLVAGGAPREDWRGMVHGNAVRVRLVEASSDLRFVGFVHNPSSPSARLLDLAQAWLRGEAAG